MDKLRLYVGLACLVIGIIIFVFYGFSYYSSLFNTADRQALPSIEQLQLIPYLVAGLVLVAIGIAILIYKKVKPDLTVRLVR